MQPVKQAYGLYKELTTPILSLKHKPISESLLQK